MKKAEALKLIFEVKAAYPVYYRNVSDSELEAMACMWAGVLDDYSFEECHMAILTYVRSGNKEILQSPGQVVDEIESIKAASQPEGSLTPAEAWQRYVRPAIRDGLYHSAENFEKMPKVVQEAIASPDYLKELAQLPSETIDSVERSNFINRMYPAAVARRAQDARIPASVRQAIESARAKNDAAERRRISIETPEIEEAQDYVSGGRVEEIREEYERRKNEVVNSRRR